jgi:hypothetical protein
MRLTIRYYGFRHAQIIEDVMYSLPFTAFPIVPGRQLANVCGIPSSHRAVDPD